MSTQTLSPGTLADLTGRREDHDYPDWSILDWSHGEHRARID